MPLFQIHSSYKLNDFPEEHSLWLTHLLGQMQTADKIKVLVVNRGVHRSCNSMSCHIRCNKKLSQSPQLVSLIPVGGEHNTNHNSLLGNRFLFIYSFKGEISTERYTFLKVYMCTGVSFFPLCKLPVFFSFSELLVK